VTPPRKAALQCVKLRAAFHPTKQIQCRVHRAGKYQAIGLLYWASKPFLAANANRARARIF
jgi:hypothetical protein